MLSLVKDWASWPSIKADYSKDEVTVFTEVTAQIIGSDYGARTLLLARGLDRVKSLSRLTYLGSQLDQKWYWVR